MIIVGHQGAAGLAPGNSIAAIEKGIDAGCDYVEVDIGCTRDGKLLLWHDRVSRISSRRFRVEDLSLDELRRVWDSPLISLDEVLHQCDDRVGLMLDVKTEGSADEVAAKVARSNFRGSVIYASFFHEEIRRLAASRNATNRMALLEGALVSANYLDETEATHVGLMFDSLSLTFCQQLRDRGFPVFTFTPNEEDHFVDVERFCPAGIVTDRPDRARKRWPR